MNGKNINFDNKNIKKNIKTFTIITKKYLIQMILMLIKYQSQKEQYGKYNSFKYFSGYNDNDVIRPLYLFISPAIGYIIKFEKNKITVSLMVKDKQLLENYNKIWKKN